LLPVRRGLHDFAAQVLLIEAECRAAIATVIQIDTELHTEPAFFSTLANSFRYRQVLASMC
jgi:hypothetical protein